MPSQNGKSQQLHASNLSGNIGEALEARIKDPLWFLARQWQTGEFEAENGGRVAETAISTREFAFESATVGTASQDIDLAAPLESVVEAEKDDGDAPAWRSEALEYSFGLRAGRHEFEAAEYDGRFLDWHHFDYAGRRQSRQPDPETRRMIPTQLYFTGAPHPRWWRFEDGDAYFDSPRDSEPNVLSLLLPEFFYTDINNWYVTPIPMRSGSFREVTNVTVIDSFGVATELSPAIGDGTTDDWALFVLDAAEDSGATPLDGRFLLAPNVALDVLENDEVEDIRFIRDEDANLVWAWERLIHDQNGERIVDGGGLVGGPDEGGPGDGLPRFVLKSDTARNWIPYVPRRRGGPSATDGEIHLRRGRTDEAATAASPQYRGRIVTESKRLLEEEVPPSGLRVRRISRYARGSDGKGYFWIGRDKQAGRRTARPGIRFDYLDEP